MFPLMHYIFLGVCGLQCVSHAENFLAHLPTFHNLTHLEVYEYIPDEYTHETLMDILQKSPSLQSLDIPVVHL